MGNAQLAAHFPRNKSAGYQRMAVNNVGAPARPHCFDLFQQHSGPRSIAETDADIAWKLNHLMTNDAVKGRNFTVCHLMLINVELVKRPGKYGFYADDANIMAQGFHRICQFPNKNTLLMFLSFGNIFVTNRTRTSRSRISEGGCTMLAAFTSCCETLKSERGHPSQHPPRKVFYQIDSRLSVQTLVIPSVEEQVTD